MNRRAPEVTAQATQPRCAESADGERADGQSAWSTLSEESVPLDGGAGNADDREREDRLRLVMRRG